MKRIIRNISLCALLAVAMGACEEEAALVNPSVAHDKSTQSPEEVVEAASLQSASAPGSGLIFRDFVVHSYSGRTIGSCFQRRKDIGESDNGTLWEAF